MTRIELQIERGKIQGLLQEMEDKYFPLLKAPTVADFKTCLKIRLAEIDLQIAGTENKPFCERINMQYK